MMRSAVEGIRAQTYTNEEDDKTLRRYWTNACQAGP